MPACSGSGELSCWLVDGQHLTASSDIGERDKKEGASSLVFRFIFYKVTNPIMRAPPSWLHLNLIISRDSTSKYHHTEG